MIHFISDLHLCHQQPHLYQLFEHYMQQIAPNSEKLYVLGDLFEVWIGDDAIDSALPDTLIYQNTLRLFEYYQSHHRELFLMHGNRDFLLGQNFCQQSGASLIDQPYYFSPFKQKIALLHGDQLCTDDKDYQSFRKMVRSADWQQEFLAMGLAQRERIATGLRQQSKQQQKNKSMQIMDVNQAAVLDFMQSNHVEVLIHGHTHRQKTHHLNTQQGNLKRIVLSDWNQQGFYLSLDHNGFKENYFSIN